jgi:Flp pilus assembly pilin Flp
MKRVTELLSDRLPALVENDEQGQSLVEYALIIMLISIAAVGALSALGGAQQGKLWNPIMSALQAIGMM